MPSVAYACPDDDPEPVSRLAWFSGLAATAVPSRVRYVSNARLVKLLLPTVVTRHLQGADLAAADLEERPDPDTDCSSSWFPVLTGDGRIPVADDAYGATAFVPLYDSAQVRNGVITGIGGSGTSVSATAVLLPGALSGMESLLVADGKRGSGLPVLRPVVSRYGRFPQQWRKLIELAHRVMIARIDRHAMVGLTSWDTAVETDPIVTLVLHEAGAINATLTSRHVALIDELVGHGGSVGVRVVQITRSLSVDDVIGGVGARDQLVGGGWAICHRSGPGAAVLARQLGVNIDLRDLDTGQAVVMVGGTAAPSPAQVRYVGDRQIAEVLAGVTARHLQGADAAAAGPAYTAAHWDDCWVPGWDSSVLEGGDR